MAPAMSIFIFLGVISSGVACRVEASNLRTEFVGVEGWGRRSVLSVLPSSSPILSWDLECASENCSDVVQVAYEIEMLRVDQGEGDEMECGGNAERVWESGRVESSSMIVESNITSLQPLDRICWRLRVDDGDGGVCAWQESTFQVSPALSEDSRSFASADWVQANAFAPPPTNRCELYKYRPSPLLRVQFADLGGDNVAWARLFTVFLGSGRVLWNGEGVEGAGEEELVSLGSWTNFSNRVEFRSWNLTDLVRRKRDHVLSIELGRGWWDSTPLLLFGKVDFRSQLPSGDPRALVVVVVGYRNGSVVEIGSKAEDMGWRGSVELSPTRFDDIYLGSVIQSNRTMTLAYQQWTQVVADGSLEPEWLPLHHAYVGAEGSGATGRLTPAVAAPVVRDPSPLLPKAIWMNTSLQTPLPAAFSPTNPSLPTLPPANLSAPAAIVDFGKNHAGQLLFSASFSSSSSTPPSFTSASSKPPSSSSSASVASVTVFSGEAVETGGSTGFPSPSGGMGPSVNGLSAVAGQIKWGNGGECAPPVAWQTDTLFVAQEEEESTFSQQFSWRAYRFAQIQAVDSKGLPFPHVQLEHTGRGEEVVFWGGGGSGANESVRVWGLRSYGVRAALMETAEVRIQGSGGRMLEDIHALTKDALAAQTKAVVSDCPGRERLGYTGDGQVGVSALLAHWDAGAFVRKRAEDIAEAAAFTPGGVVTEVAPNVGLAAGSIGEGGGSPGWAVAGAKFAAEMWKRIGHPHIDTILLPAILKTAMQMQADAQSNKGIVPMGLGDWESIDPKAVNVSSTAWAYENAYFGAQAAQRAKQASIRDTLTAIANSTAMAFNANFFDPKTGLYGIGTPAIGTAASQSQPLSLPNLVPSTANKSQIVQELRNHILHNKQYPGHFTGGISSIVWAMYALSDAGMQDVALNTFVGPNSTEYPGFGYEILNNATTAWEIWAWSDGVYSLNHGMWSGAALWILERVGGLFPHPDTSAFRHAIVDPLPVSGIVDGAHVSQRTQSGLWVLDWNVKDQNIEIHLTVPPNCMATVRNHTVGSGNHSLSLPFPQ